MDLKVYGIVFSKNLELLAGISGSVHSGETFLSAMERKGLTAVDTTLEWNQCATVFGEKGRRGKPSFEMAVFYSVLPTEASQTVKPQAEKTVWSPLLYSVFKDLAMLHISGCAADTTIQL